MLKQNQEVYSGYSILIKEEKGIKYSTLILI
jgi:hypothetical protein